MIPNIDFISLICLTASHFLRVYLMPKLDGLVWFGLDWFLMAYKLGSGYLMPKLDGLVWFGNGISTTQWLFNAGNLMISFRLVWFVWLTAYQHLTGYVTPKFDGFVSSGLVWLIF